MNNRQFKAELKAWMEATWATIGAEVTKDLNTNADTVLLFWDNHVAEAVSVAREAEYIPDLMLYIDPPRRLAAPAKKDAGHGGLTILRREELITWLKEKYSHKLKDVREDFIRLEVPGLLEFDFIETTIGGTTLKFRTDRLPYHYKKQLGRTKGFKPLM